MDGRTICIADGNPSRSDEVWMEAVWGEGSEEFQNVWNFTCDFLEQRVLNRIRLSSKQIGT